MFVFTGCREINYKDLRIMGVEVLVDLLQHKFFVLCIYVLISSMYLGSVQQVRAHVSWHREQKGLVAQKYAAPSMSCEQATWVS